MIWNDMITRLAELKNDVTNSVRSISSMSVNAVNTSDISADDHTVLNLFIHIASDCIDLI